MLKAENHGTASPDLEAKIKVSALLWIMFDAFVPLTYLLQWELGHFPKIQHEVKAEWGNTVYIYKGFLQKGARRTKGGNWGGVLRCRCRWVGTGKAVVCGTRSSPVETAGGCSPAPPEKGINPV